MITWRKSESTSEDFDLPLLFLADTRELFFEFLWVTLFEFEGNFLSRSFSENLLNGLKRSLIDTLELGSCVLSLSMQ